MLTAAPTLLPFKALIKARCGLILEGHGEEKLAAALAQRMAANPRHDQDAYFARLSADDDEFQELINLLTINETYFFREAEQLQLFVDCLVPRLLARRQGQLPLRILSAGCSSGEEPYSLVMALHEKFGDEAARLFQVIGGDIDTQVLNKARAGRYTEFSFRGVPAALKARYFEREQWAYRLKESIRQAVSFHEMNLFADTFPAALADVDVIFFRNVSIYFDIPTRQAIQRNLAALLKDDGYLMIGMAETLANDLGVFTLQEEGGQFYFSKAASGTAAAGGSGDRAGERTDEAQPPRRGARPDAPVQARSQAATPTPPPTFDFAAPRATGPAAMPAPPAIAPDLAELTAMLVDKRYDEACSALQQRLALLPGERATRLLLAWALLNRKEFAAADAHAQRVLQDDAWSIDAFLLRALAVKWQAQPTPADHDTAIDYLKQAVYANNDCWPAHYYLADLYRARGDNDKAARAYRVVLQLLGGAAAGRGGLEVLPLWLPAGEVRFLCEHQLAKLAGPAARK